MTLKSTDADPTISTPRGNPFSLIKKHISKTATSDSRDNSYKKSRINKSSESHKANNSVSCVSPCEAEVEYYALEKEYGFIKTLIEIQKQKNLTTENSFHALNIQQEKQNSKAFQEKLVDTKAIQFEIDKVSKVLEKETNVLNIKLELLKKKKEEENDALRKLQDAKTRFETVNAGVKSRHELIQIEHDKQEQLQRSVHQCEEEILALDMKKKDQMSRLEEIRERVEKTRLKEKEAQEILSDRRQVIRKLDDNIEAIQGGPRKVLQKAMRF